MSKNSKLEEAFGVLLRTAPALGEAEKARDFAEAVNTMALGCSVRALLACVEVDPSLQGASVSLGEWALLGFVDGLPKGARDEAEARLLLAIKDLDAEKISTLYADFRQILRRYFE